MKKAIYAALVFVFTFYLFGCATTPVDPIDPVDPAVKTLEDYKVIVKEYLDSEIETEVTEDIELPNWYDTDDGDSIVFTWESSNGRTLSKSGKYVQNLFDEEITLSATCEVLGFEDTFVYTTTVKTTGKYDLDEYKEIIESYIPDYLYKDFTWKDRDSTYASQNYYGRITYTSSDETIYTSDGRYVNQNPDDQLINIYYNVVINGISIDGSKQVTIEGKKDDYYVGEAKEWLDDQFENQPHVMDDINFPATDDLQRVTITWKSSDRSVMSDDGVLTSYDADKSFNMIATIVCNDSTSTWELPLKTHTTDEIFDFIITRMHSDEVKQKKISSEIYNTRNFGYLNFYVQDIAESDLVLNTTQRSTVLEYLTRNSNPNVSNFKITTGLVPWDNTGRTQMTKTSTDFITIHDTGSTMSAAQWNEYEQRDTRQTSWHFTMGEDDCYQHMPLNEVAWHAGDGSTRFGLNDTGVEYTVSNPTITIGSDHYLYINGQKSKIGVPIVSSTGAYADEIVGAWLYTCRGDNGNYFMDNVYGSNYGGNAYVANSGGNRNSVGIETCINAGIDYNQVMRNTANLVAHLLVYYNLDPSRVLQHRNFSGKLCPQVMIVNDMWDTFMKNVESEYYILKYLDGVEFTYTSNNLDLLSNSGKILKEVSEDTTVSYNVTIKYNGQSKTYLKTTVIKPI